MTQIGSYGLKSLASYGTNVRNYETCKTENWKRGMQQTGLWTLNPRRGTRNY
ncbi:MAG: hypothetical protein AABW86_03705 [Candidatus Micrarchaeota archaeon]